MTDIDGKSPADGREEPLLRKEQREQGVHERLRNLSGPEQQKMAREGSQTERVALERIYGKAVWETLLTNPRVSVMEVARISCKGAIPKPLIDLIVANTSWLSNSQVRRGLLTNPKTGREQAVRVLRAMPKHELRLVPKQTIYSPAIRESAKKLLGGFR